MVLKHKAQREEYNLLKNKLTKLKFEKKQVEDRYKNLSHNIKELKSIENINKLEYCDIQKKNNSLYEQQNYILYLTKKIGNIEKLI